MAKFSFVDRERATGGDGRKRKGRGGGGGGSSSAAAEEVEGERGGGGGVAKEVEEEEEEEARGNEKGEEISVKIDPDVLDCSICCEPLRPPLYQCQNGHVACSSCWSQLSNRCYMCFSLVSRTRSIFLEKIIESIKVSCSYAKWGCPESINFAEKPAHEEKCIFAPLKCPFPNCTYEGPTGSWPNHFSVIHRNAPWRFAYNQLFKIDVPTKEPFMVLVGLDGHVFLLLNNSFEPVGCALSIVCLCNDVLKRQFSYSIRANNRNGNGASLQLKANAGVIREWKGVHPTDAFLMVPSDFRNSDSKLVLTLGIYESGSSDVMPS